MPAFAPQLRGFGEALIFVTARYARGQKWRREVRIMAEEKLIGKISHYFGNINVGIIELTDNFSVGEKIHIKGSSTDFEQEVNSMQMDHKDINEAKAGEAIGIKVEQKVKEGDSVYKIQ